MSFLNTRHKQKSFTLTTLLLSVLLLLLFYIGLTYMDPPIEKGISINFGTMEFGTGDVQPMERVRAEPTNEVSEPVQQPQEIQAQEEPQEEAPVEELLTSDNEESIKLEQQREAKRKADEAAERERVEAERIEREKREAEERVRKEQEAKRRNIDALIGGIGNSEGTTTGSEGDDTVAGDKGNPDGDPYATSYYGAPGTGGGSGGYGLSGRSLVDQGKVQQECNQEGTVVVRITVGRNGRVIEAIPGVRGTTNSDPCLLKPAKETALLHRWNLDSNAPTEQIGFVVVNFKLGQ